MWRRLFEFIGLLLGLLLFCCSPTNLKELLVTFKITPDSICYKDNYSTQVTLSAEGGVFSFYHNSCNKVPPVNCRLNYKWWFDTQDYRILDGDLNSSSITVSFSGKRAVYVKLIVEDNYGEKGWADGVLGLVVPEKKDCSDDTDCNPVQICLDNICVDKSGCQKDDDCPYCYTCEKDTGVCMPYL